MVSHDDIARAADLLRAGRLVAFPTETVYGLGANALDPDAVARIYAAKGRPATSPLIVHVSSPAMARSLVRNWTDVAEQLAKRYWPGPLTMVLSKRPLVPDEVTAGLPTVGLRVPAHPIALALIHEAGVPIAAPSANRFTHVSPTTADHVRDSLGDAVDMILDGGPSDVGIESTVISLAASPAALLRPGIIPRDELEQITGRLALVTSADGAHPAPGLHHRHYSPRTLLIVTPQRPEGRGAWITWSTEDGLPGCVQMPPDPLLYANRLYAVLHELDQQGWDFLAVEPVPAGVEWDGVRDRLRRASSI